MELHDMKKSLLATTAKDTIKDLADNPTATSVRQTAFSFAENGKEVQVQIIVQRDPSEFLAAFDSVIEEPYIA